MKITICDRCKTPGSQHRLNRWVEVRFSDSEFAEFLGVTKKVEVCQDCFREVVEGLTAK